MLKDEAYITLVAGKGGSGRSSFFPGNKTGPDGGNGGDGGSIYVVLNRQMHSLNRYVAQRVWKAESGKPGEGFERSGESAPDLEIPMPIGTTLIDQATREIIEITPENPRILVCKGGRGGRGNAVFKSATNQSPRQFDLGKSGEERHFQVTMKLIADIGLIGLPNAGKSSLLNALTAAQVRVADYPFTTLEPNLGVLYGVVLADIPGLIEGASAGKGLGIKFLKHIEKVKLLVHCVSCDSSDMVHDYLTVRQELESYNKLLAEKKEIILLTKTDLVTSEELDKVITKMKAYNPEVLHVTILDDEAMKKLQLYLTSIK
jgi:GTP-binding protein